MKILFMLLLASAVAASTPTPPPSPTATLTPTPAPGCDCSKAVNICDPRCQAARPPAEAAWIARTEKCGQ